VVFYFYGMKVIATNIANPTSIFWNGKEEITGIFKFPVSAPITLDKDAVVNDTIANREVHGGEHKSCYLFSSDHYPYWKEKYPGLNWDWGMFGENLSVEGLDEDGLRIGDIFKIGSAVVQVSQPREPCYKLGIRFGSQRILKQFIAHAHPGTYVRLLQKGQVAAGDVLELVKKSSNSLTVRQFHQLLYAKEKNRAHLLLAIDNKAIPGQKREKLKKWL